VALRAKGKRLAMKMVGSRADVSAAGSVEQIAEIK
jgi:hypothetical protein